MTDSATQSPRTPRHVAIIMDGNGRWAQERGLPRGEGHRQGAENVTRILQACQDAGVDYLTLYAFSAENWARPEDEVSGLMRLLTTFLKRKLRDLVKRNIRFHAIGRLADLPEEARREVSAAMEATAQCKGPVLTLALSYGSRTEVLDAVADCLRSGQSPERLDWSSFSQYLYTRDLPDPDLVIRTSGETRLSNFLLLQAAYAEWYFTPIYWPAFGAEEFRAALQDYARRERRYGKTGEQVRPLHSPS